MKIDKFESWAKNEAVSKPHDPFSDRILELLDASGIEYLNLSSSAQMANGNPVIQIELKKGSNEGLIKETLEEWGIPDQENIAYEIGCNHRFNIYRRGGIRVDSSSSDLGTFSGAEDAIAWIKQYNSKKLIERICSRISPDKYLKLPRQSASLNTDLIKNVCTHESIRKLKELEKDHPETYKFMSPYILYICVFLTRRAVEGRTLKALTNEEIIKIERLNQPSISISSTIDDRNMSSFLRMDMKPSRAKGEKTFKAQFDGSFHVFGGGRGHSNYEGYPPVEDTVDEKLWKELKDPKNWSSVEEILDLKKTHISASRLGLL